MIWIITKNKKMRTKIRYQFTSKSIMLIMISIVFPSYGFAQPGKVNNGNIKRKWLDVEYAAKSQSQELDIYLPDDPPLFIQH